MASYRRIADRTGIFGEGLRYELHGGKSFLCHLAEVFGVDATVRTIIGMAQIAWRRGKVQQMT